MLENFARLLLIIALIVIYPALLLAADESSNTDTAERQAAPPAPPAPVGDTPSRAAEKPAPWPSKIGPFEFFTKDKRHSLRLGLTTQLLVRIDNKDMGAGKDRDTTAYAEARRIRPSLRASLLDGMFDFYLHFNTSPNSLDLLDCYLNYTPHPYAQLRIGQWKIPFTRYRIQSYKRLTLVDWAITSKYFGAERQIGLAIHSGLEKPQVFDYAFGIFSGVNARASQGLGIAMLYGEKVVSASNLADPGPKMELHPEFVARFGYNYNGIDISRDTDFASGPVRFHIGLSATYDLSPDDTLDFTARLAPEFLLKAYGFSLFAAYYLGWGDATQSDRAPELAMMGGLAQASYLFIQRIELALRYAFIHNMADFRSDARTRADTLIAAATDQSEIDDLTDTYKKVGSSSDEHEMSFGINVYIIGDSLKWQNDISYLLHESPGSDTHDIRFRTQLQLAF